MVMIQLIHEKCDRLFGSLLYDIFTAAANYTHLEAQRGTGHLPLFAFYGIYRLCIMAYLRHHDQRDAGNNRE